MAFQRKAKIEKIKNEIGKLEKNVWVVLMVGVVGLMVVDGLNGVVCVVGRKIVGRRARQQQQDQDQGRGPS